MFSIEDICAMCDLSPQGLRNWIWEGLVSPTAAGGKGRSKSHKFSLTQAVGIVVADRLHRSEKGCRRAYIEKIVGAFQGLTESDLLADLQLGKIYFVDVLDGNLLLSSNRGNGGVDVRAVYQWLKSKSTN